MMDRECEERHGRNMSPSWRNVKKREEKVREVGTLPSLCLIETR